VLCILEAKKGLQDMAAVYSSRAMFVQEPGFEFMRLINFQDFHYVVAIFFLTTLRDGCPRP
jgi:hypothetical protein